MWTVSADAYNVCGWCDLPGKVHNSHIIRKIQRTREKTSKWIKMQIDDSIIVCHYWHRTFVHVELIWSGGRYTHPVITHLPIQCRFPLYTRQFLTLSLFSSVRLRYQQTRKDDKSCINSDMAYDNWVNWCICYVHSIIATAEKNLLVSLALRKNTFVQLLRYKKRWEYDFWNIENMVLDPLKKRFYGTLLLFRYSKYKNVYLLCLAPSIENWKLLCKDVSIRKKRK